MAGKDETPRALADGVEVRDARPEEAEDLLPLMRAYCDFYEASPRTRACSRWPEP